MAGLQPSDGHVSPECSIFVIREEYLPKRKEPVLLKSLLARFLTLNIQTYGVWASPGTLDLASQMLGTGLRVNEGGCTEGVLRVLPGHAQRGGLGIPVPVSSGDNRTSSGPIP